MVDYPNSLQQVLQQVFATFFNVAKNFANVAKQKPMVRWRLRYIKAPTLNIVEGPYWVLHRPLLSGYCCEPRSLRSQRKTSCTTYVFLHPSPSITILVHLCRTLSEKEAYWSRPNRPRMNPAVPANSNSKALSNIVVRARTRRPKSPILQQRNLPDRLSLSLQHTFLLPVH